MDSSLFFSANPAANEQLRGNVSSPPNEEELASPCTPAAKSGTPSATGSDVNNNNAGSTSSNTARASQSPSSPVSVSPRRKQKTGNVALGKKAVRNDEWTLCRTVDSDLTFWLNFSTSSVSLVDPALKPSASLLEMDAVQKAEELCRQLAGFLPESMQTPRAQQTPSVTPPPSSAATPPPSSAASPPPSSAAALLTPTAVGTPPLIRTQSAKSPLLSLPTPIAFTSIAAAMSAAGSLTPESPKKPALSPNLPSLAFSVDSNTDNEREVSVSLNLQEPDAGMNGRQPAVSVRRNSAILRAAWEERGSLRAPLGEKVLQSILDPSLEAEQVTNLNRVRTIFKQSPLDQFYRSLQIVEAHLSTMLEVRAELTDKVAGQLSQMQEDLKVIQAVVEVWCLVPRGLSVLFFPPVALLCWLCSFPRLRLFLAFFS